MGKGFFAALDMVETKAPSSLIPQCGICGLYKTCQSPKMVPSGRGNKRILIVGEAPGKNEDEQGKQFIGKAGQFLEECLDECDINFRKDCWITNSVICRPPKNQLPPHAVDYCRPNLIKTIEELQPEVIIPLGQPAVKSLMGWLWREDVGPMARWLNWTIPCQQLNAWIVPNWHPSFVLRSANEKNGVVLKMLFKRYLRQAVSLEGRPWKEVPDFESKCIAEMDVNKAVDFIDSMWYETKATKAPLAFDFETDRLKPDHKEARIICCSLSNGRHSIGFPWMGKAKKLMGEVLSSSTPIIGANIKFETRWSLKEFGFGVANWFWDDMLCAHTLDNRPGISSVKFQAWVLLGQNSWDYQARQYTKANSANEKNRLTETSLSAVLKYCAMDSLMEWKIGKIQAKQLGVPFPGSKE